MLGKHDKMPFTVLSCSRKYDEVTFCDLIYRMTLWRENLQGALLTKEPYQMFSSVPFSG